MRYHQFWSGVLALGALAFAGCGTDTPTQPSTASPPAGTKPELAVVSNSWINRAGMPGVRAYLAAATVTNAAGQSIVYAIGGSNFQGCIQCGGIRAPVNTVTAYNVATNTWASRRPLPVPLTYSNGAGVINNKIYISGGYTKVYENGLDLSTRALYMYDPATNTWTRKRDMPQAHSEYGPGIKAPGVGGVTGVIGGKLYVVTACMTTRVVSGDSVSSEGCDFTPNPLFFRYNPVTDQWTTLRSPYPYASSAPYAGGVIGGKFYVMSGWGQADADFRVYDPATNKWTPKTPLGLGRPGAATAVLGAKLYVIGGLRSNNGLETVDITIVYDPVTDRWTRRAFLPSARAWTAATKVFLNGQPRIELVGGDVAEDNLQYIP
jgi:N-acetylneuraminic acid mutarotase